MGQKSLLVSARSGCALGVYLFISLSGGCGLEMPVKQEYDFCTRGNYLEAVKIYAEDNGFDDDWVGWMRNNSAHFQKSFCASRKRPKTILLAVDYLTEPEKIYAKPWQKEKEHMALLETALEEAFFGWYFDVVFGAPKESSDIVVHVGVPQPSYALPPKEIFLHYEDLIVHEVAHLFYAGHHYVDDGRIAKGDLMPPNDSSAGGGCTLDATVYHFCSAHSFALNIPFSAPNVPYLNRTMERLTERYRGDY